MGSNLISSETKHWAGNGCSDLLNSEARYWDKYGRKDSEIFLQGLMDGYKLEEKRIQRMRREKEEEVLIESKVRSRVKEWKNDIRSTIEKELRKELRMELEGQKKEREEENRKLMIHLEEMMEIKETLKEEMASVRELRKEMNQAVSQTDYLKLGMEVVIEFQNKERNKLKQ